MPLLGYILQLFHIGKVRETEILLPLISAEAIRSSLIDFTRSHNWTLLNEEPTTERLLYVFRSGQFGFSKEGVQKITVSFFPSSREIKCFIKSESLLGQFYDFGINQKNIESLSFFLNETVKNSDVHQQNAYSPIFFTPKPTVNIMYLLLLLCVLLLIIGSKAIFRLSRTVEPGKVIISFRQYVSDENVQKLMVEFGVINCVNIDKLKPKLFECDTPIGQEDDVAKTARSSPVVESADVLYKQ